MATIIDNIELDETNEEFFWASELVKYGHPLIYLTGKAGTGKTTFLKYLRQTTEKNTIVLAFTGVAAINAGGQTINSFFKVPFGPFVPNDKRLRTRPEDGDADKSVYFGETDHVIPWQTDHLFCWRMKGANAIEALTKVIN
jgi:ABC-type phosphate/phosphonate transport system ATPase subunit